LFAFAKEEHWIIFNKAELIGSYYSNENKNVFKASEPSYPEKQQITRGENQMMTIKFKKGVTDKFIFKDNDNEDDVPADGSYVLIR
jgi:hypothetical protein